MINRRRSEEELDALTDQMYVSGLSDDQARQFEAGFEYAAIVFDIVNQNDFAHPIAEENVERVKKTMETIGLLYSLVPWNSGKWFLSFMFEDEPDGLGFSEYKDWEPGSEDDEDCE